MDCSWWYGNLGCNGGNIDSAFAYVAANGLEAEETYPYTAADGKKCKYKKDKVVGKITSYEDVVPNSSA